MVSRTTIEKKALLQQRIRNKGMPGLNTLRHLATWLRDDAAPDDTLMKMLPQLETHYQRSGPRRITSTSRALDVRQRKKGKEQTGSLLHLPNEIIGMITAELDPAATVCIAQTCRELHAILDCSLPDLERFRLAWVWDKRALGKKMRRFVFEATEALDRDRIRQLEQRVARPRKRKDPLLVCSVCIDAHPASSFSAFQRSLPAGHRRQCLASKRTISVCEDLSEDVSGLRFWRQAILTNMAGRDSIPAQHGLRPASIQMVSAHLSGCVNDCNLTTNHRDQLVATRKIAIQDLTLRERLTRDFVENVLVRHPGDKICPHVRLSDVAVSTAYSPRLTYPAPVTLLGTKSGRCKRCETSWWFGTERDWLTIGPAVRLFLVVRRILGDLRNPRDKGYSALAD